MTAPDYAFGRFRFDPLRRLLLRDGTPLPLGSRGVAILAALLAARGEVVSKDTLLEAAWPGTIVEESNLSVQVAKLRRLVGAERIGTVERIGYRWFTPAQPLPQPATRRSQMPAVAVLPFVADGGVGPAARVLAEDVTTALVPFRSIVVAAEAGDGTARYRLRGSVRQLETGMRVNVRLEDIVTASHVWAQTFDAGPAGGLDDVSSSIAAAVESHIHLNEIAVRGRAAPEAAEAYDFYLQGRARQLSSEDRDNAQAFAFHSKALALEPDNPVYLSSAAEALHHRISVGWAALQPTDRQTARDLVRRTLDSTAVDGTAVGLAGVALLTADEWDWGQALCRRGAALNPNSPLALVTAGHAALWADDLDTAEMFLSRSIRLNPSDPTARFAWEMRARVAIIRGDIPTALDFAHRSLAISPWVSSAHWSVIEAYDAMGRRDKARQVLEAFRRVSPTTTLYSIAAGQAYARPERLAPTLAAARRAGLPER